MPQSFILKPSCATHSNMCAWRRRKQEFSRPEWRQPLTNVRAHANNIPLPMLAGRVLYVHAIAEEPGVRPRLHHIAREIKKTHNNPPRHFGYELAHSTQSSPVMPDCLIMLFIVLVEYFSLPTLSTTNLSGSPSCNLVQTPRPLRKSVTRWYDQLFNFLGIRAEYAHWMIRKRLVFLHEVASFKTNRCHSTRGHLIEIL